MSNMLKKVAGMAILIATIGVASCQALFAEAPGIKLPTEQVQ